MTAIGKVYKSREEVRVAQRLSTHHKIAREQLETL
jgi:hypothetical protein